MGGGGWAGGGGWGGERAQPPARGPLPASFARGARGHATYSHPPTHPARAHLAHWAVGLVEIRLEEGVKEVARDALDSVLERQHVHALAILDIGALVHGDDVAQPHAQVLAHHLRTRDGVVVGRRGRVSGFERVIHTQGAGVNKFGCSGRAP